MICISALTYYLLLLLLIINGTMSVRPSVPSIGSSSDVQLVCRSSGAGGRYRSIVDGGQRHTVIRWTRVDADLLYLTRMLNK